MAKAFPRASARRSSGRKDGMNGMEKEYHDRLLMLQRAGEIGWIGFEAIKLRLAKNTFYTPDFMVILADGSVEFHEVKGSFWEDDARVKIKVAAETFPNFTFRAMMFKGGVCKEELFG